jgi:hypothetical protein
MNQNGGFSSRGSATAASKRCRGILAIILAFAAMSESALAQDDEVEDPDAQAELEARIARRPLLHDQQFDMQIFGRVESIDGARARMNEALTRQVQTWDGQYGLTSTQKQKLYLAGQGDIKRLLDRVEALRKEFLLAKFDRNAVTECLREARRLRRALETPSLGNHSLLAKILATTITEEQKARHNDLVRAYQSGPFDAGVAEAAARLGGVLNLRPEQHRKLLRLLQSEIRQPRQVGGSIYAYVMHQLSKLPEDKVRPIFGDSQWKFLHELLVPWSQAEEFLENDGFILDRTSAQGRRGVPPPI